MILEALIEQAKQYTTHASSVEYYREGERTYNIMQRMAINDIQRLVPPHAKIDLDGEEIIIKYFSYCKCQYHQVFNLLTTDPTTIAWEISNLIADIAQ